MDADLSHDPLALPALVSAATHGADVAIGSRYVAGGSTPDWTWRRAFLSRWGNRYAALALGLAVNDSTSGYRAYRADALRRVDLGHVRAYGYGFQVEMTYRLINQGGRVVEIPVAFVDRRAWRVQDVAAHRPRGLRPRHRLGRAGRPDGCPAPPCRGRAQPPRPALTLGRTVRDERCAPNAPEVARPRRTSRARGARDRAPHPRG